MSISGLQQVIAALGTPVFGTVDTDNNIILTGNLADDTYENIYAGSEGYIVDVYENGVHLRGRDFVNEEFLPIASYWLNTTLQTVEAGTYTDSTGTIVT